MKLDQEGLNKSTVANTLEHVPLPFFLGDYIAQYYSMQFTLH